MEKFNSANYGEAYIEDLKKLIKIPSVIGDKEPGAPFGKDIDNALDMMLKIAEDLGFKIYKDPDGYYGYSEVGEGDELIGVLGHLDVVPAKDVEQWETPPFEPEVREGKLFGRGTQDDKGPTLAVMYAIKQLLDEGHRFEKRVRIIYGTDEETLWRGIEQYMGKEEVPSVGFTPDSVFPMIHGEKGLLQLYLRTKGQKNHEIEGGSSFNALADHVELKSKIPLEPLGEKLKDKGRQFEIKDSALIITGKSAHSAKPEGGANAINQLAEVLEGEGFEDGLMDFIRNELGVSQYGEKIFGKLDDVSGPITINVGKIKIDQDTSEAGVDIRIPVTVGKEKVEEALKKAIKPYGLEMMEHDYLDSIYLPKDHFLIQILGEIYHSVTGEKAEPLTSGGATYARSMPNCVAFGAVFPGRRKTEHQPNEHVILEDIYRAMTIYGKAVKKLTER